MSLIILNTKSKSTLKKQFNLNFKELLIIRNIIFIYNFDNNLN